MRRLCARASRKLRPAKSLPVRNCRCIGPAKPLQLVAQGSTLARRSCGKVDAVRLTVGVFLPGEAFGGFFGLKEFTLTLSAHSSRIFDAPADSAVVHYFFDFHSPPFAALKSDRRRPEGARSESKLKAD